MKDVLDAWIESSDPPVSVNYFSLSNILRSSNVGLHDVAEDFYKVCRLHTVHGGLGWGTDSLGSPGVVKVWGISVPTLLHPPWDSEALQELHLSS